jgi:kynureninase
VLGLTALECGIDLMAKADMRTLREKSLKLGETFIALMDQRCGEFGFDLIAPRDPVLRGSQVAYAHPNGYELVQALKDAEVIGDFRTPDILRFGLTPLYLRFVDVYDAVERLRNICSNRAWDKPQYRERAAVT